MNKLLELNFKTSDIGKLVNKIFYTLDTNRRISYLNEKARRWINIDLHTIEQYHDIDIDSYFEVQIAYVEYNDPDTEQSSATINYNLQKVWFPTDLDFKLCLISTYPCPCTSNLLFTIVPLQDRKHLKNRLVSLIKEEEFIQVNKEKYKTLTKREKEILNLISKGLNNIAISKRLFISRHTVEQHRKNARKKLGASTTAELLTFGRVFNQI